MKKGIDYIVVDELPIEQREALKKWLIGQTLPSIENENSICCYMSDYDDFKRDMFDGKLLTKFFKGWITSGMMNKEEWYDTLYDHNREAQEENCEIIMFKVPKRNSNDMITEIEKLLQEKLK